MSNSTAPVKSFRLNGVTVAIWKNFHDGQPYYSTQITHSYKDSNGDWKDSKYLNERDLPTVAMLVTRASMWIGHTQDNNRPTGE